MLLNLIQNSTEPTSPGLRSPVDGVEERIPEFRPAQFVLRSWSFLQKKRKTVAGEVICQFILDP